MLAGKVSSLYTQAATKATGAIGGGESGFGALVESMGQQALNTGRTSEALSAQAMQGKAEIADVVMALNNAEITLQTVVSIRDKMVNAVQEIMRMPV
jgi:flagellar hook-basal body complex protein FliE